MLSIDILAVDRLVVVLATCGVIMCVCRVRVIVVVLHRHSWLILLIIRIAYEAIFPGVTLTTCSIRLGPSSKGKKQTHCGKRSCLGISTSMQKLTIKFASRGFEIRPL